ncbi:kinase [Palleronia sediminis]|uniref:Kinase n=1 Tax=Palleronia sediminis TaxID=2547833 RepID=A0A4R6AB51_9RHOB|nr:PfkB family carbohydrate kinase [Palleronia sediminis]TDL79548.1 kinase [Palleronia sediminis]
MSTAPLCIGSVLWDLIGCAPTAMRAGDDRPGRIRAQPGGVALNIAMGLARLGHAPDLLSAVGCDPEGDALLALIARHGIGIAHVHRPEGLPTDRYMAIEGTNGLIAAIADAHTLEAAGARILAPLEDGRLATPDVPFEGCAALDGNLPADLLARLADAPWLARADLRVAPASPGKAERLIPLLSHPRATFYVNRAEAGILLGATGAPDAADAAPALVAAGAARAIVTDGAAPAAMADAEGLLIATPPPVRVVGVTGAGDAFMAAHIAAERGGADRAAALDAALAYAASHISKELAP